MNNLIDNCMKLGFGMMRLPRIEGTKDIDLEQTKRMVGIYNQDTKLPRYLFHKISCFMMKPMPYNDQQYNNDIFHSNITKKRGFYCLSLTHCMLASTFSKLTSSLIHTNKSP